MYVGVCEGMCVLVCVGVLVCMYVCVCWCVYWGVWGGILHPALCFLLDTPYTTGRTGIPDSKTLGGPGPAETAGSHCRARRPPRASIPPAALAGLVDSAPHLASSFNQEELAGNHTDILSSLSLCAF